MKLIDKEALLEAIDEDRLWPSIVVAMKDLINSAPAVSGDAVAWMNDEGHVLSKIAKENYIKCNCETGYKGYNIKLYLAPPQPQSQAVEDALEKASDICYEITANTKYQSIICYDMSSELMRRIRKLIIEDK